MTNFDLSCENDKSIDSFLFGRIVCFLCLDYSDFLQLSFMPIEDEETRNKIKNGINQFEVLRNAKECMNPAENSGIRHFYNISHLSPLLIHRADLITAGIPQDWFLNSNYQEEDFDGKCKGLGILGRDVHSGPSENVRAAEPERTLVKAGVLRMLERRSQSQSGVPGNVQSGRA